MLSFLLLPAALFALGPRISVPGRHASRSSVKSHQPPALSRRAHLLREQKPKNREQRQICHNADSLEDGA